MPTISALLSLSSVTTPPPNSTCMPAFVAGSVDASRASAELFSTSSALTG